MRKLLLFLLILLLVPTGYIVVGSYSHADLGQLPPLESGDLIFQTSVNSQTLPIIFATGSLYTHVGIIHKQGDEYTVIHSAQKVIESPLSEFITYGWGEKFLIERYRSIAPEQREAIAKAAQNYLGRGYDYVFYLRPDQIYCSELPYLAYDSQNVRIGHLQKIGELNMDNFAVRNLFKARWKMHPACNKIGMDYDACWKTVLELPIITPVSLSRDAHLETVYSNYLF